MLVPAHVSYKGGIISKAVPAQTTHRVLYLVMDASGVSLFRADGSEPHTTQITLNSF